MNTLEIILATISAAMLVEGTIIAIFPKSTIRTIKEIFKNKQNTVKMGLIEIILALLILLIIAL